MTKASSRHWLLSFPPSRRVLCCATLGLVFVSAVGGCGKKSAPPAPPAPPKPAGIFRNVADEAGVTFRWGHGGRSPLNILETLGHGCAFLDFDQDGWLDLLLVGNRRCALYHNLKNGRFEDVSVESGFTIQGDFLGVAVGDYDNDGFPDVYVTGYGKCALYHNTRRGVVRPERPPPVSYSMTPIFEHITTKAGVGARHAYDNVSAATFADLDSDGKLDLFAGRYIIFTPKSLQFCTYSGIKAGCGIKHYPPDFPRVYRNDGNSKFTDVTKAWGFDTAHGRCLGVTVQASEGKGGVTLYAANDELPGDLFVRKGARYVNLGVPSGVAYNRDGLTQGGMGTDWGDYNNDGKPDLIVATFQGEANSLYRNDGNNVFTEVGGILGIGAATTAYVAWTAKFFDYDNDGWNDLLVTNGHTQDNVHLLDSARSYPQPLQLFRNEQGRRFLPISEQAGPAFQQPLVGRGAAFGDYDNDGKVDVLIVDEEGAPLLLHNEDTSGHHWLGVRLIGTRSNRDGIGARVTVTAGGRTLTRDQDLSGGYVSAHDPRLHFGLGSAAQAEKIVVRWPSGQTDVIKNVPGDQYIEIKEGQGQRPLDRR